MRKGRNKTNHIGLDRPRILLSGWGMRDAGRLQAILESLGYQIILCASHDKIPALVTMENVDLILLSAEKDRTANYRICERLEADESLRYVPILVLTREEQSSAGRAALDHGADSYVTEPFMRDEVLSTVKAMLRIRRHFTELLREKDGKLSIRHRSNLPTSLESIIGKSQKMQEVYDMISAVAQTDSTVLIYGETGTGKEMVAQLLHSKSRRWETPFIVVNCAALPETLIQSELFGHEKGAFTGAIRQKPGKFELAHTGTIFLDEVGELSPMTQLALLRVLQQRKFERVGGEKTLEIDVRVIAATNRNLEEAIAQKKFREDLYYRLSVIAIELPPLRERKEDIDLLSMDFLRRFSSKMGREINGFSKEALELMTQYDWPGNIRELENVVERAVIFCKGNTIVASDLPPKLQTRIGVINSRLVGLAAVEKELILRTLTNCGWNKHQAAKELGIDRGTLYSKIEKYGLERGVEKSTA